MQMMNADVIRYKYTAFTMMPGMKMYTTLSDRLKQAGIKERKPEVKKGKNSKKRKPNFKRNYAPHYMGNGLQSSKKLRKEHFVLPHLKKPLDSNDVSGEIIPKETVNPFEDSPETEEDNSEDETIFVSLDFIEDCQNYKKKVRKPSDDRPLSKSWRRSTGSTSSNPRQHPDKTGGSQKPQEEVGYRSLDCMEKQETKPETEDSPGKNHLNLNTKKGCEVGKEHEGSIQHVQSSLSKLSSNDTAKIDRKYLESILSIANSREGKENKKKVSEDESEGTSETDSQLEKKTKLPGKVFFERKVKAKGENFKKDDIKVSKNERKTPEGLVPNDARIVRDLTKSEEQIKLKRDKNSYGCNNFKVKSKIVAHSKPDFKDISRRKRKPGNKFKKNTIEEFIETSLPSEVSKVADVKELWRRKNQEKSENSLSSHSSSTVPETEEILGTKNSESYKIPKKIVELEICNTSRISENKDKTGKVKNKESKTQDNQKESEQTKKKEIASEYKKNVSILKKRLTEAGYILECEGKMQKSQLVSFLAEDVPIEASPNLKRLEEKAKEGGIVPSQVIEKWSILNRLEQAFLGLGTPTFPNKNTKNSNFLKGKHSTGSGEGNASGKKLSADGVKESKRTQKNKEAYGIRDTKSPGRPIPSSLRNRLENSGKTITTILSGTKLSVSKEKHQRYKIKKESKRYDRRETVSKDSKPDENNSKQKVKKPLTRTHRSPSKKSKTHLSPSGPSKGQNLTKRKSSKTMVVNQKKNSEENLERKKTFSVLQEIDTPSAQLRKSRSVVLNDSKLENRLSQNKIQISKKQDCKREEQKLRSCSTDNNASTRTLTIVPKNPMADKSLEVSRDLSWETQCQKENRGTVMNSREAVHQGKETEKRERKKSHSGRTHPGRNSNNSNNRDKTTIVINESKKNTTIIIDDNNTKINVGTSNLRDRIVKKRSILSMHAKQHRNQSHMKLNKIKETDNPYGTSEKIKREIPWHELKNRYSNTALVNTRTYDLRGKVQNNFTKEANAEVVSGEALLISTSTLTSVNRNEPTTQDDPEVEQTEGKWKTWRKKPRWEQDISHYLTIVKEIMSQYKRIDGFLKQNEQWNNFNKASGSSVAINVDDSDHFSGCGGKLNIHEYRKKIISEYEELPIFEYKSKLKQTKGNFSPDSSQRKNNLSVVRDANIGSDLDVKDSQPKVQRVLDSQLYVDADKIVKRNEPNVKFKDKNSSLQDCRVGTAEKGINTEDWRRSCSTLKSSLPQETRSVSANVQRISSKSSLDNLTSISTMGYCQETESESF